MFSIVAFSLFFGVSHWGMSGVVSPDSPENQLSVNGQNQPLQEKIPAKKAAQERKPKATSQLKEDQFEGAAGLYRVPAKSLVKPNSVQIQKGEQLKLRISDTPKWVPQAKSVTKPVQSAPLRLPRLQSGLQKSSLEDIEQIRKRIGIKLFDGANQDRRFASELKELNQTAGPINMSPSSNLRLKSALIQPFDRGASPAGFESPAGSNRQKSTVLRDGTMAALNSSLLESIRLLDQAAWKLERSGEFSESKKMRKLSRRLQKQLRISAERPDN